MNSKKAAEPRSMFQRVTTLLGQHLDMNSSRWTYKTNLEEIGIDGFNIVEFFFVLEDELNIELDFEFNIRSMPWATIGQLVAAIDQSIAPQAANIITTFARAA